MRPIATDIIAGWAHALTLDVCDVSFLAFRLAIWPPASSFHPREWYFTRTCDFLNKSQPVRAYRGVLPKHLQLVRWHHRPTVSVSGAVWRWRRTRCSGWVHPGPRRLVRCSPAHRRESQSSGTAPPPTLSDESRNNSPAARSWRRSQTPLPASAAHAPRVLDGHLSASSAEHRRTTFVTSHNISQRIFCWGTAAVTSHRRHDDDLNMGQTLAEHDRLPVVMATGQLRHVEWRHKRVVLRRQSTDARWMIC